MGGEPGAEVMRLLGTFGWWALVATLIITPARLLFPSLAPLVRARRLVGLWVSAYVVLHLLAYWVFVLGLDTSVLWADISEKPYAIAGAAGFMALLPLTITSTRGWMRRLGKDWKRLHRLVYVAAFAVWVHIFWQVRSDYAEAILYGGILVLLAVVRLPVMRPFVRGLFARN